MYPQGCGGSSPFFGTNDLLERSVFAANSFAKLLIRSIQHLTRVPQRRRQRRIIKLFGTIDYDPAYDYKAERRRKRL
jgi:hypothetical protein